LRSKQQLIESGIEPAERRFALLPIQDEMGLCEEHGLENTHGFISGEVLRMEHLGIQALRPDFYGQASQFLNELGLCVSSPDAYANNSYSRRIRDWWRIWASSIDVGGPLEFDSQMNHNVKLRETLEIVTSQLSGIIRAKLELWIRMDPDKRELVRWATSNSLHTGAAIAPPRSIRIDDNESEAGILEAFTSRRIVSGGVISPEMSPRWTHYIAQPVSLIESPWLDMPVGVISLLINAPGVEAEQFPASLQIGDEIAAEIVKAAIELLQVPLSSLDPV
jgi:hypothetical protein